MDMLMLACRTSDTRDDGPSHFLFNLCQDFAVLLAKWAEAHRQAQLAAETSVYCVEIFHSAGEWGTVAGLDIDQSKTDWVRVADHAEAKAEESVELETVKVMSDGVIFSASWNNDDSGVHFETPVLPWKIVNLVAAGKAVPVKDVPVAEIDDEEDEQG